MDYADNVNIRDIQDEMPAFEQNHIQAVLDSVKEMFDSLWLSLLSSPDVTSHTVDVVCGIVSDMLKKSLELIKPNPSDYEKAVTYFSQEWCKTKSEYLRKQELYKSGDFIQPEKYALNDRMEPVATFDGQHLRLKTDYMAFIPLEIFGGDFLAIQLYDDDYGTTNPLQTGSASFYKMIGCYYRILNMPAEFQSTFEHIFLAYLAYSNDMALNRHGFLRATIVHQLRQLENEGITVLIHGSQVHFRVVLFNLFGDNLGLNQNGGYKSYFLGDNACRICHFNWEEICSIFEMSDNRLRTAEEYDEAAMSDNFNVRNDWGVKENSAFNDLELFHVQECPSVDLMHDLFQGHVRYLIPMVFRSFENYDTVFNAVAAFPFQGKDSFNIPRPTQNGDRMEQLKGMTASTVSTFIRLLPLILADILEERTKVWNLLLLFQKIYDIVMAQHAEAEMLDNLKDLVQQYLSEFTRLGGHMTVKPHYMTHYEKMIKMYGPLWFSWSMRYEAKHQPFKQYSNVNRCHKNLPYTLAWKHQAFACDIIRKMEKRSFDYC
uniref:Uncharacterized protein n=1 Tax=Panagrolaimus superbus TaxID=310955 RepID=A0A914YNG0_9BILA